MSPVPLPSGLVTFVITDIEGSTRLLRTLGDRYEEQLAIHNRLLRSVWETYDGAEVNTEGDSFIVAFGDATNAVLACAAALRAIDEADWGEYPFRIRIGAHCGPAYPRDGDYVSLALHRTARVAGTANGRQAVVSADVVDHIDRDRVGSEMSLVAVGRFGLRDFDGAVELFAVEPQGWDLDELPLRAVPAEQHNLLPPPSPRFDRVDELDRLWELVEPGTVTTVWGPGGVGKTRLASEFGRDAAASWPDGIWLVNLAAAASPSELVGAIARATGASLAGDTDPSRRLLQELSGSHRVLLLDNCEHLVGAVAVFIDDVRTHCPSVAVLATSRSPIGVRGERRLHLEPFRSATPDGQIGPSVEMFQLRSADVDGAASDPQDVAALCDRLDGLPLAIELAAARSDVMTPSEMLTRLEDRLRSLRLADPGLPGRHQSIDATIDWSYDLLSPVEQSVLRRLTVLRSSFDLGAAVAACDLDEADVADAMWALVSNSVVDRDAAEGSTRFRLYSTVRTRVRELLSSSERAAAANGVATYFDATIGPDVPRGLGWASAADTELANLRELIDPSVEIDTATRCRLLWCVGTLHDVKAEYRLGIESLRRSVPEMPCPELVGVLTLLADLHLRVGDRESARDYLADAQSMADSVGPAPWDLGGVARTAGEIALRAGEHDEAERIAREALDAGAAGQPAARLWNLRGLAAATAGDMSGAIEGFTQELRLWEQLGDDAAAANVHGNLAEALLRAGDTAGAARRQLNCLETALDVGQPVLVAFSTTLAAHLAGQRGEWQVALELQGASDELLDQADYALYDADQEARTKLIDEARLAVGEIVSTWLARGRNLDRVQAAERATSVLSAVATTNRE